MTILLIPQGQTPTSPSWIERDGVALTWSEIASSQGATRIEIGGGTWAVAHGFPTDVYGFVESGD